VSGRDDELYGWNEELYRTVFVPTDPKPITDIPEGCKICPKCGGTGVGAPGETYSEMGTSTFGCSECHSFGYVSKT